jgi:hypothetical protein
VTIHAEGVRPREAADTLARKAEKPCPVCGATSECGPCARCLHRLTNTLDSVPEIYAHLHFSLQPHSPQLTLTARRRAGPPSSTAPLRESVFLHSQELSTAVHMWSAVVLPQAVLQRRGQAGWLLQQACRALARELPDAATGRERGCRAAAVLAAAARARLVLGHLPVATALPGPCPSCDLRALTYREDEYLVECRYCRRVWPAHLFFP